MSEPETNPTPEAATDPKADAVPSVAPVPASGDTNSSPAPSQSGDAPKSPQDGGKSADNVPELVRVAKAERRAAAAIKDAEAKATRLAELETKQTQFNGLVAEGKLLEAAQLYFPNDEALQDKLFWQLTDHVAGRPDKTEPTVEEQIAKALADDKAKAAKEADEKAEADKKAKQDQAAKNLAAERAAYFGEARKMLAKDPGNFPFVTKAIIAGDVTQDEITAHVEAIGEDIFKLGLPEAELMARIRAETTPENILAALETVLAKEAGQESAPAASNGAGAAPSLTPETIEQITEAAIAAVTKRAPPGTISSSAMRGAPPVAAKPPEAMTVDELNNWAIAEVEKRRGTAAAR